MSVAPRRCEQCKVDSLFEQVGRFPSDNRNVEVLFAVSWRCPSCEKVALDVCPVGPIVPEPGSCLNCGTEYPGGSGSGDPKCPACGMSKSEALAFLGLDRTSGDDPVEAARGMFKRGLFRRGLGRLNHLLSQDPRRWEAWLQKAAFLQSIGYRASADHQYRKALEVLDVETAQAKGPLAADLLAKKASILAEQMRGEDSLSAADT